MFKPIQITAVFAVLAMASGAAQAQSKSTKNQTTKLDTSIVDATIKDGRTVDKVDVRVKESGLLNTKVKVQDNPAQTKVKVQEPGLVKGSVKLKTPK